MSNRLLSLAGDLRQAFDNFTGSMVSGPWEDLIDVLASVINAGQMDLQTAARVDLLLARTQGGTVPDECGTCRCPMPGMAHPG